MSRRQFLRDFVSFVCEAIVLGTTTVVLYSEPSLLPKMLSAYAIAFSMGGVIIIGWKSLSFVLGDYLKK